MDPKGVLCFSSPNGGQTLGLLWEPEALSSFHDEELAKATKEINAILKRVERSKPSEAHELSFVEFRTGSCWSGPRTIAVSPYDDDDVIAEALGLTGRSYRPRL
jgi:hypothetical protein